MRGMMRSDAFRYALCSKAVLPGDAASIGCLVEFGTGNMRLFFEPSAAAHHFASANEFGGEAGGAASFDRGAPTPRSKAPGSIGYPGLSAFSRSDGFQLRLHFFRLPRLGLRAIGLRARPRALDHRLWFFARTRLFHCPLRKESFLVAHRRPPVMTYLWSPRTEDSITAATPAVVWRSRCRAPFAK